MFAKWAFNNVARGHSCQAQGPSRLKHENRLKMLTHPQAPPSPRRAAGSRPPDRVSSSHPRLVPTCLALARRQLHSVHTHRRRLSRASHRRLTCPPRLPTRPPALEGHPHPHPHPHPRLLRDRDRAESRGSLIAAAPSPQLLLRRPSRPSPAQPVRGCACGTAEAATTPCVGTGAPGGASLRRSN